MEKNTRIRPQAKNKHLKQFRRGTPIRVTWVDISTQHGWRMIKEVKPYECETIGFFLGYQHNGLLVSPTLCLDDKESCADLWHIPIGTINKIRKI